MADDKKNDQIDKEKYSLQINSDDAVNVLTKDLGEDIPKEAREKLEKIQSILTDFKKKLLSRFQGYVLGITLLPPNQETPEKKLSEEEKNAINVFVLLDDANSQKLSKAELKEKLTGLINDIAKDVSKNLSVEVVLISEVWSECFDGKYDLIRKIATSAHIFDRGMLSSIKIAEIHKQMVLEKFEKYIVSYVLAGSLVQGLATSKSDIDVFIVIDDTDVKKLSRVELLDKLRAIILSMGIDAGRMTGIMNKLNIQVYILTDFWDNIKEANPVIFTFLRDGVPFFDRGIFMPWKQLLKLGKIKPSPEAIDMYMHSGDQLLDRVSSKLLELGSEDFFWATLTPSQAAIMMMGIAPPTPKETPKLMRSIFVEKEKILENEYVDILERIIKLRKDIEHGELKKVTGAQIDEFLSDSKKYLSRLKELFEQIAKLKNKSLIKNGYESILTLIRELFSAFNLSYDESNILDSLKKEFVNSGKISESVFSSIKSVFSAFADMDNSKSRYSIQLITKDIKSSVRFLMELIERKKANDLNKIKYRITYGDNVAELVLFSDKLILIPNMSNSSDIELSMLDESGAITETKKISEEEYESLISKITLFTRISIKNKTLDYLKKRFGETFELVLN